MRSTYQQRAPTDCKESLREPQGAWTRREMCHPALKAAPDFLSSNDWYTPVDSGRFTRSESSLGNYSCRWGG